MLMWEFLQLHLQTGKEHKRKVMKGLNMRSKVDHIEPLDLDFEVPSEGVHSSTKMK